VAYDYDLFVIGAGSGGVRAARLFAALRGRGGTAEEEGVNRWQQVEAVGPGVHPVGLAIGAQDVAVERDLHRGDKRS